MINQTPTFHHIKKGMDVYDSNENKIGTVQALHYGSTDVDDTTPNLTTVQKFLQPLLNDPRQFPDVIYNRMYQEGFLRVQRGLLQRDAFVFADEVKHIAGQDVHLNVPEDELLEG